VRNRLPLAVAACAFALGLFFASFSTYDFVSHLDRQVHGLHCSFIPGIGGTDVSGNSGCHATLMSPYSSVMREAIWGGLPISLPAMGVFAFLLFFAAASVLRPSGDRGRLGFLALGAALPLLASGVMGWISYSELGAACKLCIGIYVASTIGFVASVLALRGRPTPFEAPVEAVPARDGADLAEMPPTEHDDAVPASPARFAAWFALGCVFVAVPAAAYVAAAPDFSRYVGACGELPKPDDVHNVMVPLPGSASGRAAIEVFDPLCPTCRAFEDRLAASSLRDRLQRKAVLFPLDDACNWMVGSAVHPGACDVSEAILCAGGQADEVIAWAFEQQEAIKEAATADPKAGQAMVERAFPALADCIGSPAAKSRLNRSLRWAVANQLPVMTPQLYVDGRKLCDEDIDLGLDWALSRLLNLPAKGAP
jgi:uncharacterized membrane protein